ncbi:hypothetical protein DEJ28_06570 [Curtobacterium sp. MCPF17_002]|uniref:hypothetical protein n=1 Tax=Curtobacterium sp. MCPF17_002 TaxID=2175645 RepID=UPI000DAA0FBB|nr:hypothetical protein [Curtobacterium sp. MCPF17_002]WIB78753.1 hypothetical protein DEJ28_06570 [Curtobacterium sp. MCPF17_002]
MNHLLDSFATQYAGQPLERLDQAQGQPLPEPAFTLPSGALQALFDLRGRGLVSAAKRNTPAATALREAGLLGRFGGASDTATTIAGIVERAGRTLAAERVDRSGTTTWSCWASGPDAVVRTVHDDNETIDLLPFTAAVARLVAWSGIEPFWPVADPDDDESRVVSDDVVDAMVAGREVDPPADAGPVLAARWREPWSTVSIAVPGSDDGLPLVFMGSASHLRIRVDGGSRLQLVPSYWVFEALPQLLDRSWSAL